MAWAVPQDHLLSLGISFSILCAKVQSAFLYLSLSMALSHLSAIISYLALPSEALSSAVTSLAFLHVLIMLTHPTGLRWRLV